MPVILSSSVAQQKLKQELPMTLSVEKWSSESEALLQDCFASTDWNMFLYSFDSVDELTTSVTCFIKKCSADGVPNS